MFVPTVYVDGSILYGSGFILVQQEGRFFSAKDYNIRDNVTETTVDGDINLALENESDVRMSEGEGGETSPTLEVGETSHTLNSKTKIKMLGWWVSQL